MRSPSSSTAYRLRHFREELGLNKNQLAEKLDVQPLAVLMWEKKEGGSIPRAETFIKLAKFALKRERFEDALWFLDQADVDTETVLEISRGMEANTPRRPARKGELVEVQPLREAGEDGGPLSFPLRLIANPRSTRYVRSRDDFQQLRRGDILLIDESEKDLFALGGSYVAIYRSPEGFFSEEDLEFRRKMLEGATRQQVEQLTEQGHSPFEHLGVYAGWLRVEVATAGSTSRAPAVVNAAFMVDAPSRFGVLMSRMVAQQAGDKILVNGDLKVLGRVVAWIANASGEPVPAKKNK